MTIKDADGARKLYSEAQELKYKNEYKIVKRAVNDILSRLEKAAQNLQTAITYTLIKDLQLRWINEELSKELVKRGFEVQIIPFGSPENLNRYYPSLKVSFNYHGEQQ